jgi:hypothetical protein
MGGPSRVGFWVLVCLASSGCLGGSQASVTADTARPHHPAVVDGFRLYPAPAPVVSVCAAQARRVAIRVLCPTLLPRASQGTRPSDPPATVHATSFPAGSRYGYHVVLIYSAPWEQAGKQRLNSPRRFLHFEVLGLIPGRLPKHSFTRVVVDPRARAPGGRRFLQPLRPLTVGARRGMLYAGLPYNQGGNELGGHLTFIWHDGRIVRVASLHAWEPRRQTLDVLRALIESLR